MHIFIVRIPVGEYLFGRCQLTAVTTFFVDGLLIS